MYTNNSTARRIARFEQRKGIAPKQNNTQGLVAALTIGIIILVTPTIVSDYFKAQTELSNAKTAYAQRQEAK